MLFADLEQPDVALLGAGREGRSVWRQIRRRFSRKPLTIYTETPLGSEFTGDFQTDADQIREGPFDGAALGRHDFLVRSPGVSPYRSALLQASEAGARFTTATSLWFGENPAARTICITGTKGKSTTSALCAHLMREAGCRVQLAGNIGRPLLDCGGEDAGWWVIELSSYQLADLEARPTIAAILNLSDAHLEWHGGRQAYHSDKLRIAELSRDRPLVANYSDATLRELLRTRAGVKWFGRVGGFHVHDGALWGPDGRLDIEPSEVLPGEHNLLNIGAALTILELAGIDRPDLQAALGSFEGLPHRLQYLGSRGEVTFINDSMATTPVATLAALQALEGRVVTLIIGGTESTIKWSAALEKMRAYLPHAIIALPDSGPALVKVINASGLAPPAGTREAENLAEAVQIAREITPAGGTVLLSPGAPSFPQFRDFADRGGRFAELAGFRADEFGGG